MWSWLANAFFGKIISGIVSAWESVRNEAAIKQTGIDAAQKEQLKDEAERAIIANKVKDEVRVQTDDELDAGMRKPKKGKK